MGFDQEMETITLVVDRIEREAIRAAQRWSKRLPAEMKQEFDRELYADRAGNVLRLRSNTPGWQAYKARRGLDRRRGHATLSLASALGTDRLVSNTPRGFDVDVMRAVVGRTAVYPSGQGVVRVPVSSYAQDYARQKAPTLGQLNTDQRRSLEKAVLGAIRPLVRALQSSVAPAGQGALTVAVTAGLDSIGLRVATRQL